MDKPDKIVPANLEAEEAVLGSLLIDPDAIIKIAAFLKPDDYYREKNGWIYQAILELHERREPADFVTLVDDLERRDQLQEVGGLAYITALVNSVPTAVHVEYYARIVERTATLRRLIGAAGQIAALAYEEAQDVDEVVDRAEQLIFGVSERRVRRDLTPVRQIMGDVVNRIEYLHSHKGEVLGVPTGFSRLDRLLGGFQKSDLIILAARPGVGKCIVSGSRLLDPETGRLVTIDEIVQQRRGNLLTLNGQACLRPTQPSDFVDDGIKPVYRVRTALGREITTTASHPFLTVEGWQRLEHLAAGDGIAVPRALPYFGTRQVPEEHVECLADRLSAGHPTHSAPGRAHEDPAGQADLTATPVAGPATRLDALGKTRRSALAGHPSQDTLVLRASEPGLWDQDAPARRVPPVIFELTRPLVALFLKRLLAGAGRLCPAGGGAPISYTTASYALARDVQHLLLRFGILAELRHQPVGCQGDRRTAYELAIRGRQDVGRFLAEIDRFGGEGQVQERLAGAGSDLYWDTIESIEYVGERQVYDLTVDGTHNFVAEDMLVHNTSLALNLAANAAKRFGQRVAFFSLEMSSEQLLQRLLSAETGINQQRLRLGDITEDEWLLLMEAASELSESLLFIDDTPAVSALELRTKARRLQAEHGLDMLIVDYLQLMRGDSRNDNRVQEISYITRSLKGLARELEVPLIALSQLSRAVEQRTDHKPVLSDLRESGSIEQDADIVMFIYREDMVKEDTERKNVADVIVAKHRNGPTDTVPLYFDKTLTKFADLEMTHEPLEYGG